MRGPILVALCAGLLAGPVPASAAGPDPRVGGEPGRVPLDELSEAQVQTLVRKAVEERDPETARALVRDYRRNDPGHRDRVEFVEALILEADGRYEEAAASYRRILASSPDLVGVRVRLSKVLFLAKDDDAARHQLDTLVSSGVDDRLGGELGDLIDRIDARRPFRGRVFLSALPSTNLNSGTDGSTVLLGGIPLRIDDSSRRRSGVGVLFGGEASYRYDLSPAWSTVVAASAIDRWYPSVGGHLVSATGSVGLVRSFDRGRFGASVIAGRDVGGIDLVDWRRNFDFVGLSVEGSMLLGGGFRISGGATARLQEFQTQAGRDGGELTSTVYLDRFLSPTSYVRGILGTEFERTKRTYLDFDEVSVGVGGFREFPAGISLYAEVLAAAREYDGTYPGLDGNRSDRRCQARGVLTKRDLSFWGVAPQISYTFTRNRSNSVFDDFSRHDVELRLTSEF